MSASIVRKGLDLFREDLMDVPEPGLQKSKKLKTATIGTTNKAGLKKFKKKGTKNADIGGAQLTVKGKKVKSVVRQHSQHKAKDSTEEAIKFLGLLSSKKTSSKVVSQVSEYQQRRGAKKPKEDQNKPKEPKSCFSEADFARFEREYFVGPRRRPAV